MTKKSGERHIREEHSRDPENDDSENDETDTDTTAPSMYDAIAHIVDKGSMMQNVMQFKYFSSGKVLAA